MPRLHINLPKLETLEEWEEIEDYRRQTPQQKQPYRPDNVRNEAQERRVSERRK
jgi:hypothetical protein